MNSERARKTLYKRSSGEKISHLVNNVSLSKEGDIILGANSPVVLDDCGRKAVASIKFKPGKGLETLRHLDEYIKKNGFEQDFCTFTPSQIKYAELLYKKHQNIQKMKKIGVGSAIGLAGVGTGVYMYKNKNKKED